LIAIRIKYHFLNIICLPNLATYSNINDEDLDELVTAVQNENNSIGIRMLKGHLFSKGYRIQRERIRQSLLRTDPTGVVQRWKNAVKKRKYNVFSPLALWHIDGNHKLIRYNCHVLHYTQNNNVK
jgi:hypothetical protein